MKLTGLQALAAQEAYGSQLAADPTPWDTFERERVVGAVGQCWTPHGASCLVPSGALGTGCRVMSDVLNGTLKSEMHQAQLAVSRANTVHVIV